jgi:hypothetical protein
VDAVAAVVLFLGAAIWVGGYVTVTVVARVASRTLSANQRIAFFRLFGRVFGAVTTVAYAGVLVGGGVLLRDRPWDATHISAAVVAAAIVIATVVGVWQARAMTRLRAAAAVAAGADTGNAEVVAIVARGARSAALLRLVIGVLTFTLVGLGLALMAD